MKRRYFDARIGEEIGLADGWYAHRGCAAQRGLGWVDLYNTRHIPGKLNNCHICKLYFNPVLQDDVAESIHFL
jgi:hypothetical protein